MKKKLIIIVPLYRSVLSEDEQVSLKRMAELCSYPKCVVAPKGLRLPKEVKGWDVERFDSVFFDGIQGYNRLMLSEAFYARFSSYDYMLIHQTDVFMFRDDLAVWCKKGYPFVGAPWLIKRKYQGWKRVLLYLRAIPHRLQGRPFLPLDFGGKVGNGGLSLRKVKACEQMCKEKGEEINRWLELSQSIREYNEDCFWASRKEWVYPSAKDALQFGIDLDPSDAMVQNNGQLPMGCHGWTKSKYRAFWWPYISQYI